jgi:flagellar export protein FliJ
LVKKAEDYLGKRRKEYQETVQATQKLAETRERVLGMIEVYKAKLAEKQARPGSIAETTNFRAFMTQLLQLVERVEADLEKAAMAQQLARQRVQEAEIDLFKMQAMVEKDQKAVAAHQKRQEQRQMDAMGITQFNLKSGSSPSPASGSTAT